MKKLLMILSLTIAATVIGSAQNGLEAQLPTGCEHLQPAAEHQAFARVYAVGVQIYVWTGSAWAFVGPVATLYPNDNANAEFGTHYSGPTWKSRSGSLVVGKNPVRCTPDPASIPWLLLEAARTEGSGIFANVSYIQRVYTSGGIAPATPGVVLGEEVRVPYTTEYVFYRPTSR